MVNIPDAVIITLPISSAAMLHGEFGLPLPLLLFFPTVFVFLLLFMIRPNFLFFGGTELLSNIVFFVFVAAGGGVALVFLFLAPVFERFLRTFFTAPPFSLRRCCCLCRL